MTATRWAIVPEESTVWIEGSSTLHAIRAEADGLHGWVRADIGPDGFAPRTRVRGEIAIDVERLASGNALVDMETRRRIDARRHPEITGVVASSSRISATEVTLSGTIGLRGEYVDVSGIMHLTPPEGGTAILEGDATFDVRLWGLKPPRLGLLRVSPDIDVRIRLVLTQSD